jgi:hypothetical protein
MDWLLGFLEQEYEQLPDDLNIRIPDEERSEVDLLPVEGAAMIHIHIRTNENPCCTMNVRSS